MSTLLAKIGTEKRIMLSGMKRDQTEADFSGWGLQPADGILIASDMNFMAVLNIDLQYNDLNDDAKEQLRAAANPDVIDRYLFL